MCFVRPRTITEADWAWWPSWSSKPAWRLTRARWVRFPHASATIQAVPRFRGIAFLFRALEMGPHVITRTLMTLARHRDYRTTRRYVRVDGDHLRAAVERLADRGCHPGAALVDSLQASGSFRLDGFHPGNSPSIWRQRVFGCVSRMGITSSSEAPEEWRTQEMKQASRKQNARAVRPRGSIGSLRFVGMWADRAEMKDSAEWIRIQRAGWIKRSPRDGDH